MDQEKQNELKITERKADFSQWYMDVIAAADLAEHSPVRGCMIIKPYGYAIWENMVAVLDKMIKDCGVQNAYFPLFIPESFLKKEAEHVEGFSPELAIVTIGGGKKLEEPLVVRPTSETIMYETFSKWIHSYRDLPLLINQWANVVRWEMRPRLFLRTTEFLWQEGHTAHAEPQEAESYALMILDKIYKEFAEKYMAMPVYTGKKSEKEKFAGAKQTFCIEALMQDGKTLQAGTSHDLSDNFAKSFDVKYQDKDGESKYVYQTSWGVSTRLIGGLIMSHSDDKGLVLPPKIAPIQIVIVPIYKDLKDDSVLEAQKIFSQLENKFKVKIDLRENLRLGEKIYEWEKKGVPLRLEIGPKDLAKGECVLARRDNGEKTSMDLKILENKIAELLSEIQKNLFDKAYKFREETNKKIDNWEEFEKEIEKGGYLFAFWCEEKECEEAIKEKTKANSRLIPFDAKEEAGEHTCFHCGKKTPQNKRWIFCRSY